MAKKLINIRLSEDLWQEAKVSAVRHKVSLQDWLTDAIILKLKRDTIREDKSNAKLR